MAHKRWGRVENMKKKYGRKNSIEGVATETSL